MQVHVQAPGRASILSVARFNERTKRTENKNRLSCMLDACVHTKYILSSTRYVGNGTGDERTRICVI